MKLACTTTPGNGDLDYLLCRLATNLQARGIRTLGTVQINSGRDSQGLCDMDIRLLPDGPDVRISQSLGQEAAGCRLDPNALEFAVHEVSKRLKHGADCLIINKFGKHEALGRGFREVIAMAIEAGIPVLVGLNARNQDSFQVFADGQYSVLSPDLDELSKWIDVQLQNAPVPA